jgi:DNA repair photolyase
VKIKEINAKSIIVKSNLPDSDYVVNPYVGCKHGCIYCYARFMKRFTDHNEPWGEFLDVKVNAPDLVPINSEKYKGKSVTFSSVTDPYQPIEKKYKVTRGVLEKLVDLEPELCIMTKSVLVTRDIDVLQKFKRCKAGVSLSTLDADVSATIEPFAASPQKRISAVKKLYSVGVSNFVFISPILPGITDWRKIIDQTMDFTDEYWFENLNIRPAYWVSIKNWLKKNYPELLGEYQKIRKSGKAYWKQLEREIRDFAEQQGIKYTIYFYH